MTYHKFNVLILARGGSKSIPKKNLIKLGDKPIIAHPIISAKSSDMIEDVYVSTDDAEIKSVSLEYGAKVIDRPSNLAQDHSLDVDSILTSPRIRRPRASAIVSVKISSSSSDSGYSYPSSSAYESSSDDICSAAIGAFAAIGASAADGAFEGGAFGGAFGGGALEGGVLEGSAFEFCCFSLSFIAVCFHFLPDKYKLLAIFQYM